MKKLITITTIMIVAMSSFGQSWTNEYNDIKISMNTNNLVTRDLSEAFIAKYANETNISANTLVVAYAISGYRSYLLGDYELALNRFNKIYTDYRNIKLLSTADALNFINKIYKKQNKTIEATETTQNLVAVMQEIAKSGNSPLTEGVIKLFPIGDAGLEATKSFYQNILLNYTITEQNKSILEKIKGEYLKIKDL